MTAPAALSACSIGRGYGQPWNLAPTLEVTENAAEDPDHAEEEDDEDDPDSVLAKASTMLYQLQNTWVEDRRAEIDTLWKQLEWQYGVDVSREGDEYASIFASGSGAEVTEASDSAAPGAEPPAMQDDEAAREADQNLDAARAQLQSARSLRSRIEKALTEDSGVERESDPACLEVVEDDNKLTYLRREVERLQEALQRPPPAVEDTGHSGASGTEGAMVSSELTGSLSALSRWVEDMERISSTSAGHWSTSAAEQAVGRSLSPPRSNNQRRETSSTQRQLPTPLRSSRTGFGSSPTSKRELARIAEERAMEWAASGKPSPLKASCKSPSGANGSPQTTKGGLLRPTATIIAAVSAEATQTLSPKAVDAVGMRSEPSFPSAKKEPDDMARQLDEILSEFDEIDRIYESSLCKTLKYA